MSQEWLWDISSHPNVIIKECHGGGGGDIRDGAVFEDIAVIYLTHPLPKVSYYYVLIRYCKGCTFGLTHL